MIETKEFYSFEYSDGEARNISMSFTPGDTWPEVLEAFVSFMGAVYGYSLKEQVGVVTSSPYQEESLVTTWSGPVFNPEDCL